MRHASLVLAAIGSLLAPGLIAPAMAHASRQQLLPHWGGPFGAWYGGWQAPAVVQIEQGEGGRADGPPPQDRTEWLRQCRRRLGDNGVGGAVIGGVVGGLAGNAIAGRGDKVLGTVAGAAVGAVAGAAIDKAEDAGRTRDRCEAMLDDWARAGASYPAGYGYGYGYAVPVMLVPVAMAGGAPAARGPCKETVVTEEIITTVPRRSRLIPRRAVADKRVRLLPDQRLPQ